MDHNQVHKILIEQVEIISFFKEKTKDLEKKLNDLCDENAKLRTILKEYVSEQSNTTK